MAEKRGKGRREKTEKNAQNKCERWCELTKGARKRAFTSFPQRAKSNDSSEGKTSGRGKLNRGTNSIVTSIVSETRKTRWAHIARIREEKRMAGRLGRGERKLVIKGKLTSHSLTEIWHV